MGSLAGQFLLESLLAPFVVASLVLMLAQRAGDRRLASLGPLFAVILAIATAYVMAFGWPIHPALGARNKIMIAAIVGSIAGLVLERRAFQPTLPLAAGAIAIALWVGLPALQHGRPASALLVLPIALALLALWLFAPKDRSSQAPPILMMLALAFGLGAIALFAKTFSLAQISFALASALLALLVIGRATPTLAPMLLAAAMLLALATALLLYSEASILAVIVLGTALAAGPLSRLSSRAEGGPTLIPLHVFFCLLPTTAAILIARIDAGPISLY